ncbi:MAG: hypothetical protein JSS86_12860 [Cyanobacteria bacterium SZAS LIN-2]|nr:hypothetical protein [Cyanobacteria bacterium SZAS LIN-3]MBS1997200.1 hypothetical protein [Cyanobacteria bacterium SZAS LIN-2]MBS2010598.1 hypothetical protein [Cyanobacteria bacterium SZAS TMP-1]
MDSNTFWDRRATSVVLGLFTTGAGIHGLVSAFSGLSGPAAQQSSAAAGLILLGSIAPFMIGLLVTMVAATSDKLVNITWTGINNMFGGLLGGYAMWMFGLSAVFTGSAASIATGGVIAGIGASLAVASLIKWP